MGIYFTAIRISRLTLLLGCLALVAVFIGVTASKAADRQRFLPGWLIAVDAGHGGHDKGAWFPDDGLVEKDINLDVAHTLSRLLATDGASIVLIRADDTFVQLGDRVRQANMSNARLFVSIHVNRYPEDKSCCGAQVFYRPDSTESRLLAKHVQDQLLSIDPFNNRLAMPGRYKVLLESKMPAVLVEIGFATNSRDRAMMMTPRYRRDVVYAIRNGIIAFARSQYMAIEPQPTGFKNEPGGR